MITEQKIKNFLLLAEELNFSKAAQKLYISQQALSAQIASLEHDLGFPLFVRTTKTVSLTEAGGKLADFFHKSTLELEALMTAYRREGNSLLRIGCFENLDMGSMLFQTRDALKDSYPHLSCQLSAYASFSALFHRLEDRAIDIAIMPLGLETPAGCSVRLLTDDVTYAFISRNFPGWENVHDLLDLKDAKLFAGPEFNCLWQYLHDYFQGQNVQADLSYAPDVSVTLERMIIESGEGVGFGGRYSLFYRNPALIRIPIDLTGQLGAVWKKDSTHAVIRSYLKSLAALF